jgi:hypothetical protein
MPGEQAASDAPSSPVASGRPLNPLDREPETQTADWATGPASSDDDYDWDSGMEASQNVAKTPTGAAGEEKLKPSMLCKNKERKKITNRTRINKK